jgi:glycosyltransferase involved in cell wall biosynthesis
VRNGANFLEAAVQSLRTQTMGDFELILSDNASEDATPEICQRFSRQDTRVRYHRFERNVGAARNYNQVFALARGRFFKWAAHDDLCLPGFLETCIEEFSRAPEAVLVYPRVELINDRGEVTGTDEPALIVADARPHVRLRNFFQKVRLANPVFGLMRTDALRQTRLIGSFVSSDLVLLAELLLLGEFREVPVVLFRRRLHEQRSLQANRTQRDLLAWFDPAQRGARLKLSVPTRLAWEYTRSVLRLPLPWSERIRCLAVTGRGQWWPLLRGHAEPPFAAGPRRVRKLRRRLRRLIPTGSRFILVDEDQLRGALGLPGATPFTQRDGVYWGPPADDRAAVDELDRARRAGATHIAFAWPAFWWLDYYAAFAQHLRTRHPCVWKDDHVKVYDLRTTTVQRAQG